MQVVDELILKFAGSAGTTLCYHPVHGVEGANLAFELLVTRGAVVAHVAIDAAPRPGVRIVRVRLLHLVWSWVLTRITRGLLLRAECGQLECESAD